MSLLLYFAIVFAAVSSAIFYVLKFAWLAVIAALVFLVCCALINREGD